MFPNVFKTGNATPIFEDDNSALTKNYQTISLLSNIS